MDGGQVVLHVRQRLVTHEAEPLDVPDVLAGAQLELGGDLVTGRPAIEREDFGALLLAGLGQVVVQAGQLERPVHLAAHDLGPDAAFADQQALVDQDLDRLAHGGPREAQVLGEGDLVGDAVTGSERAVADGTLELLGDLEVERHGTGAVDADPGGQVHDILRR